MSFQRILVVLESSSLGDEVFEQALNLAVRDGSCLLLAHCLTLPIGEDTDFPMKAEVDEREQTTLQELQQEHLQDVWQAQQGLESYYQKSAEQGIKVQFSCEVGDARAWICELARSWNADLIAIGYNNENNWGEHRFGSVSHHVMRHAPCKVMVVQPGNCQDLELQYA